MSRFRLIRDEEGYGLSDSFVAMKPLRIRFDSPAYLRRLAAAGRRSELVARAVGVKPGLSVLDCTAGLGRDGFLLAHLGCEVTLIERSKILATLLADGLARAAQHPRLSATVSRVTVQQADSIAMLTQTEVAADVIYLDPMFPRKQGSAAVKGEMQALQNFIGTDQDALSLLLAARRQAGRRIVLKRPAAGIWQPPVAPIHVFAQRNACYEIYPAAS